MPGCRACAVLSDSTASGSPARDSLTPTTAHAHACQAFLRARMIAQCHILSMTHVVPTWGP